MLAEAALKETPSSETNKSEEEAISELVKSNPQKRLIKPIEVAEVVSWLCDQNSDSINGQNIPISGGEI